MERRISDAPFTFVSPTGWLRGVKTQIGTTTGDGELTEFGDHSRSDECQTYWGTHGCHKKAGHKNKRHICRDADTGKVCSAANEINPSITDHTKIIIRPGLRVGVTDHGYLVEFYE